MNIANVLSNLILKPLLYPGKTFRPNTFRGAETYFKLAKAANKSAVRLRRPEKWGLRTQRSLDPEKGFDIWDLSGDTVVHEAVDRGLEELNRRVSDDSDGLRGKPFLRVFPIDDLESAENAPYYRLATHKLLLGTIAEYLGMVPVLQQMALWYSPNSELLGRSQYYHLDPEDRRQVKVFVLLDEVTPSNGPLCVIRSDMSRKIWDRLRREGKLKTKSDKIPDELIFGPEENNPGTFCLGPAGTVALVDTCNCYHYGSRPGPEGPIPRKVLFLHYTTPFARNLRFRPPRTPADMDALLMVGLNPQYKR